MWLHAALINSRFLVFDCLNYVSEVIRGGLGFIIAASLNLVQSYRMFSIEFLENLVSFEFGFH